MLDIHGVAIRNKTPNDIVSIDDGNPSMTESAPEPIVDPGTAAGFTGALWVEADGASAM